MKRKSLGLELRLLPFRILPLLLGGDMVVSMFTQNLPGMTRVSSVLGVLAGIFMVLGAGGWLLLCYRAEPPVQTQLWQQGVLLCYTASGLCCLGVAGVRDIFGGRALDSYGSEMVFGGIVLLLTGVAWLRLRSKWKMETNQRELWER